MYCKYNYIYTYNYLYLIIHLYMYSGTVGLERTEVKLALLIFGEGLSTVKSFKALGGGGQNPIEPW